MSLAQVFLSAHGRISRLEFWLGFVVILAISIPVALVLDPAAFELPEGKPENGLAAVAQKVPTLAETLWGLALTWPSAALSIKRFNDRDRPWWTGWALGAAVAALVVFNGFGLMLVPDSMSLPEKIGFAAILILVTWSLIDNGFYRGTTGPNRYGPDPLGAAQT